MEQTPYKQSQSIFQTGQKDVKQNTIIPVTIRMAQELADSTIDDNIMLDSVRVDCLSIVARITNFDDQQSKLVIQFDDGTGALIGIVYKVKNQELPEYFKTLNFQLINYYAINLLKFLCLIQRKNDGEVFRMHSMRTKGPIKSSKTVGRKAMQSTNTKSPNAQPNQINDILNNPNDDALQKVYKVGQYLCDKSDSKSFTLEQMEQYFPDKNALKQQLKSYELNGIFLLFGNDYQMS